MKTKTTKTAEQLATALVKAGATVKTAKTAKTAAPKTDAKAKQSKRDICRALLTRKQGATSNDLCKATGWAAISVPPLARALGLKLTTKPREAGGGVVYFGKAKA